MTLINLTPHTLNVHHQKGVLSITPSGEVARVSVTRVKVRDFAGIPVFKNEYGNVEGLPTPQNDHVYVVSGMVLSHPDVKGRSDVFAPGELVRDDAGKPIGCKGLTAA